MPQFEHIQAKQVLNKVKAPSMPFDWSINPYRGCQHGCSFCYARATHRFLELDTDDTFQNHILLKENAVEALDMQLRKMVGFAPSARHIGTVCIGTATDPYQQVEAKARLTRGCLEVLAKYDVPVTITTRSPLIQRDIDLLKNMNVLSINISINTLEPKVWRSLEPSSPHPAARMRLVGDLAEAGLPAGVFLAPIVPHLTDSHTNLETVITGAAKQRAAFVMPSFMRLSTGEVKGWFMRTIRIHYPHLVADFRRLYRSGKLPDEYKQPVQAFIDRLLNKYGLTGHELERLNEDMNENPPQTEQLSFSF